MRDKFFPKCSVAGGHSLDGTAQLIRFKFQMPQSEDLSFRVPLASQSTPLIGFSTQSGVVLDEDGGIVYLEEGSHWWRRRRRSCW